MGRPVRFFRLSALILGFQAPTVAATSAEVRDWEPSGVSLFLSLGVTHRDRFDISYGALAITRLLSLVFGCGLCGKDWDVAFTVYDPAFCLQRALKKSDGSAGG